LKTQRGGIEIVIFPVPEDPIFTLPRACKVAPPFARTMDPICHLAGVQGKKTSIRATLTAAEKPLTGSTATRSNCQSNTNVRSVGAASGNRASVKPV
jgi:hypothetical protein